MPSNPTVYMSACSSGKRLANRWLRSPFEMSSSVTASMSPPASEMRTMPPGYRAVQYMRPSEDQSPRWNASYSTSVSGAPPESAALKNGRMDDKMALP